MRVGCSIPTWKFIRLEQYFISTHAIKDLYYRKTIMLVSSYHVIKFKQHWCADVQYFVLGKPLSTAHTRVHIIQYMYIQQQRSS